MKWEFFRASAEPDGKAPCALTGRLLSLEEAMIGADIFFDDSHANVESARQHVATGHVPHGVRNLGKKQS